MKRIVATLFFLGLILGALALVLPGFINWNKHKDFIVSRLQPYVTRQIDVKGDIRFQILPDPLLSMEDVVVSGAASVGNGDFIHLKALEAKISLEPLLQGKIVVENINLVEPDIVLGVDGEGRANWAGILSDKFTQNQAPQTTDTIGGFASSVALNQVSLTRGKVTFQHAVTGAQSKAENLNLVIAAPTLLGPHIAKGDMVYEGSPVNVELETGAYKKSQPVSVRFSFQPIEGLPEINFSGAMDSEEDFHAQGELTIRQGSLSSLSSDPFFSSLPFLKDVADIRAMLDATSQKLSITGVEAKFSNKTVVKGDITAKLDVGQKPFVSADLKIKDADLSSGDNMVPSPQRLNGHLILNGENIRINGYALSALDTDIEAANSEWTIKRAEAFLSTGGTVSATGILSPTRGEASLSVKVKTEDAKKMSGGALALAGVGKMDLAADYSRQSDGMRLENINAVVDDHFKVTGSYHEASVGNGAVSADAKISIETTDKSGCLSVAGFVLDPMLPAAGGCSLAASYKREGNIVSAPDMQGKTGDTAISASLSREADKISGSLVADTLEFAHGYTPTAPMAVDIKTKTLSWRDEKISDAAFRLETTTSSVKLSGLTGKLWSGDLAADVNASKAEGEKDWTGSLKGKLSQVNLDMLRDRLEFKGFALGTGDLIFDLQSAAEAKGMFDGISGSLHLKTPSVKVENFNVSELPALLSGFTTMPEKLDNIVAKSMQTQGDTTFKDFNADIDLKDGKATIEKLSLANDGASLSLKTSYDLSPESYEMSGDVTVTSPEKLPVFSLQRKSSSEKAEPFTVDAKNLQVFVKDHLPPPPPPPAPEVKESAPAAAVVPSADAAPQPPAVEEKPAPPASGANAIRGIMDRLEEEGEGGVVEPPAQSQDNSSTIAPTIPPASTPLAPLEEQSVDEVIQPPESTEPDQAEPAKTEDIFPVEGDEEGDGSAPQ